VEYCDLSNPLSPHCRLHTWFIGAVAGAAVVLILALGLSCVCCPCCCLYAMCRKN
jgi:hypothetical protein